MRLLLLIISMVLGSYVLFTAMYLRRRKKLLAMEEEFESTLLEEEPPQEPPARLKSFEKPQRRQSMPDPLLDDYAINEAHTYPQPAVVKNPIPAPVHTTATEPEVKKVTTKNQQFIALNIMSKHQNGFPGHLLAAALKANHFHYGKQKIFHRHVDDNPAEPILYSVASFVEPGYFEHHHMTGHTFPGVVIFMVLPGVMDPASTFEKMLISARQLAASLNSNVCDANRAHLTAQNINRYRESFKESV